MLSRSIQRQNQPRQHRQRRRLVRDRKTTVLVNDESALRSLDRANVWYEASAINAGANKRIHDTSRNAESWNHRTRSTGTLAGKVRIPLPFSTVARPLVQ